MAVFDNFKWYDWLFAPLGVWKSTVNIANDLGISKALTGKDNDVFGPTSAQKAQQQAEQQQFDDLQHAEMREDTAIQRQVADLEAAGLNPVLAGILGGSSSGAAMQAVYSRTQEQQAQAQQTQALASLLSSAAMLFISRGKGVPVVGGNGSSAKRTTYINHAYYMNRN